LTELELIQMTFNLTDSKAQNF